VAFTQDLLAQLRQRIRIGLFREDSGFCLPARLDLPESQRLPYIVLARLLRPLQRLLKRDLIWMPTDVPGTEVAEVLHQEINWRQSRRGRPLASSHRGQAGERKAARRQAPVGLSGLLSSVD